MSLVSPPPVLDPCCGSRKFYFDKTVPYVLYGDIRDESYVQCDGRILEVHPDMKMDVTALPFEDESFALVVFDPPHLKYAGARSYMRQSYGVLPEGDPLSFLQRGFKECWRVLRSEGTLIFKWNDNQVPLPLVCPFSDSAHSLATASLAERRARHSGWSSSKRKFNEPPPGGIFLPLT